MMGEFRGQAWQCSSALWLGHGSHGSGSELRVPKGWDLGREEGTLLQTSLKERRGSEDDLGSSLT